MKRIVCVAVVLCVGCGYQANFPVPEGVSRIAVKVFKNDTLYRNADFEFTQQLIREINAKTPLKIVDASKADLVVSGRISHYQPHVLREGFEDQVEEYQLTIGVDVIIERPDGTVFWEMKNIRRSANYSITRGETQRWAREEAMRELARKVVSLVFERW